MTKQDQRQELKAIADLFTAYKTGDISLDDASTRLSRLMELSPEVARVLLKHLRKNNVLKLNHRNKL